MSTETRLVSPTNRSAHITRGGTWAVGRIGSLNPPVIRHTLSLSNRKKPGLGEVDDERPSDGADRLGTGSESDRELREIVGLVLLI